MGCDEGSYWGGEWWMKVEEYLGRVWGKGGGLGECVVWERGGEKVRRVYEMDLKEEKRRFVVLVEYGGKNGFWGREIVGGWKEVRGGGVRKICGEEVKGMVDGRVEGEREERMEGGVVGGEEENIEREGVDMVEGMRGVMRG